MQSMNPELSEREHDVLTFFKAYVRAHGHGPFHSEIGRHLGFSEKRAWKLVHQLLAKGYLRAAADRGYELAPAKHLPESQATAAKVVSIDELRAARKALVDELNKVDKRIYDAAWQELWGRGA